MLSINLGLAFLSPTSLTYIGFKKTNTMIKIVSVPFDEKSSFQKGSRMAPQKILETLHSGAMNLYAEKGISIENEILEVKTPERIYDYADIEVILKAQLEGNYKVLSLGGDHSITFPIVKAHHHKYGKFDILHIDAHTDLYDNYEGDKYSHACPFARIMETGFVNRLVQVGIRTLNTHQREQAKKFDVEIHEMQNLDFSKISKFENPLYISLDMDAFDPAFAPGVSHHEPGGLTSRQVLELIQNLDVEIIGADIVEYNPNKDVNDMTAYLAAKLLKEIVAKMM